MVALAFFELSLDSVLHSSHGDSYAGCIRLPSPSAVSGHRTFFRAIFPPQSFRSALGRTGFVLQSSRENQVNGRGGSSGTRCAAKKNLLSALIPSWKLSSGHRLMMRMRTVAKSKKRRAPKRDDTSFGRTRTSNEKKRVRDRALMCYSWRDAWHSAAIRRIAARADPTK